MEQIKFRRVIDYEGTFSQAVAHINKLPLDPGEPFLCSYKENEEIRYFLAIGTTFKGQPTIKFFPAFSDFEDFRTFVKNKIGIEVQVDFAESISSESDVVVGGVDSGGKTILKIKDGVISGNSFWEKLE